MSRLLPASALHASMVIMLLIVVPLATINQKSEHEEVLSDA